MVQPKVRGLEIEAARQANERDRTSADQVNPRKSGTPAPHSDAERQIVSPNPTGDGDHTGSLAKALGVADRDFADGLWGTSWLRVRVGLINSTSGSCSSR